MDTEYQLGKGNIYALVRFNEPKTVEILLGERGGDMLKFTPCLWYEFIKFRHDPKLSTFYRGSLMVSTEDDKMKLQTTDGRTCLLGREKLDFLLDRNERIMDDVSLLYLERIFYKSLLEKLKEIQKDERLVTSVDWAFELIHLMMKMVVKSKKVPEDHLEYSLCVSKAIHTLDFEQLAYEMVKKNWKVPDIWMKKMRKEMGMSDHVLFMVWQLMDDQHN
ncbi:hypothetical protein TNCV_922451 [Trichonephila clavipes]|nr:hypothetical protein TNCV_922451 [Trichonephila clavipes]